MASSTIEKILKLDVGGAIGDMRDAARSALGLADSLDAAASSAQNAGEATKAAGDGAKKAKEETKSWTDATGEQAGALDALKESFEWLIAAPAAVLAVVGAVAALTTEVRAAQQEVRRAAEAAGIAESEVLALREAAAIAGVEIGDLRDTFDSLGEDGQAAIRKLGTELQSAEQATGRAKDAAREWSALLATIADQLTGIGTSLAETAQPYLRGLALGSAAVLAGGAEAGRQVFGGSEVRADPQAILDAFFGGGASIIRGEQERLAAARAVEAAQLPFYGPEPLPPDDPLVKAAEEQAERDTRAAEAQAQRDAEQTRLIAELVAAADRADVADQERIAAQEARGQRSIEIQSEQAAFMRSQQEREIAARQEAAAQAQAAKDFYAAQAEAARAARFGQAQTGIGAAGALLGGDALSVLGMAGPYGALAAQAGGALAGLGQTGAKATVDALTSQVEAIAAGIEALPDLIAEGIPALVEALIVEGIPALVRIILGPELPLAIWKALIEVGRWAVQEAPALLRDAFVEAFTGIWRSIREFFASLLRLGGDPRSREVRRAQRQARREAASAVEVAGPDRGIQDLLRGLRLGIGRGIGRLE